jgi:hypothetical protein
VTERDEAVTGGNEGTLAEPPLGHTSRRRFLQGAAGATGVLGASLAAPGVFYKIADAIAAPPARPAAGARAPAQEQYLLQDTQVVNVDGSGLQSRHGSVAVDVPPLHDHVITAKLNVPASPAALREAQRHLESVLADLETRFAPTPAGVGVTIAWGLPYFRHFIPCLGQASGFFGAGTRFPAYLPADVATSKAAGKTVYALQDARTFPSDQPPPGFGPVRLEDNDVAVLLRSDSLAHITSATSAVFGSGRDQAGSLFTVTSIRQGFAGGGFYGQQGLPSKLALAAGIPGAASIPRQSPLFLGFTSTLVSNMGPDVIANLETLPGLTDQWPNGYFRQGTTMHLSHLYEDLETWYEKSFPRYEQQVHAMQYPGITPAPGTYALQPPGQSATQVAEGVKRYHSYGHSGSLSVVDSTTSQTISNYGERYPAGTTIPVRGDFNTLDNPFHYTSNPTADHYSPKPAAGLHFLMFQPTIEIFNSVRLAMDGHFPGSTLPVPPHSAHAGINSVLHTTHRQNYLVPPRRHRSFPLAEFLT